MDIYELINAGSLNYDTTSVAAASAGAIVYHAGLVGETSLFMQGQTKGKKRIFQKSFSVAAKDTTTAGDTFTGYYLAEKMVGKPPEECLRIACAAAALAVTRKGAVPSISQRNEIMDFLCGATGI